MTESILPRERFVRWPLASAVVLIAAMLTLIFAHALAAYWSFYHLGTGGSGLFLLYFAVPIGFVLALNATFFVARLLVRRGASTARALCYGALGAAGIFTLLVAGEIWRTTDMRSGEGPGAGNLRPYVLHHFGVHR
jgi:hypothetical protein